MPPRNGKKDANGETQKTVTSRPPKRAVPLLQTGVSKINRRPVSGLKSDQMKPAVPLINTRKNIVRPQLRPINPRFQQQQQRGTVIRNYVKPAVAIRNPYTISTPSPVVPKRVIVPQSRLSQVDTSKITITVRNDIPDYQIEEPSTKVEEVNDMEVEIVALKKQVLELKRNDKNQKKELEELKSLMEDRDSSLLEAEKLLKRREEQILQILAQYEEKDDKIEDEEEEEEEKPAITRNVGKSTSSYRSEISSNSGKRPATVTSRSSSSSGSINSMFSKSRK